MSENVGTSWKLLDDAHDALRRTVQAVGPEDWDRPSPCELWTVAQVLQHAAGDQLGYASTITGEGALPRTRSPHPGSWMRSPLSSPNVP